jgi:hypothetical protein
MSEFTFTPNVSLADSLYNFGLSTTNIAADTLDGWLALGVEFKKVKASDRKEYVRYAVSHPEISMTFKSMDNRLSEAVRMVTKFGTLQATEAAIDAYNLPRATHVYSLQNLSKALCAVKTVATPKVTVSDETVEASPTVGQGNVLQSILAMLQSDKLTHDDYVIIAMAVAHGADKVANVAIDA